jgi:uncharacterized protein YjcR
MPSRERFAVSWMDSSIRVKDIARRYGVSDRTIIAWAERLGLPAREGRKFKEGSTDGG